MNYIESLKVDIAITQRPGSINLSKLIRITQFSNPLAINIKEQPL